MAYITDEILEIFANCISGVESGGQIYGNGDWDNITLQYTNSSEEHAITIGAYQRFATEAKALLSRIRQDYPAVFKKYDTASIGSDLDSKNWSTYQLPSKTCAKAKAIAAIIGSAEGIKIQKKMMAEDTQSYANTIESKYGVHRIDALLHCVNIRHLGGMAPLERIIGRISGEVTLEKVRDSLLKDTKYNQVGAEPYRSRQAIMYKWLHEKVTPLLDANGLCGSPRNWLQKGDSGSEVREMQELLIANGFDCGSSGADGEFGDDTEKAVKAFQAKYGLTVDGQYGEKSKAKLESLSNNTDSNTGGESTMSAQDAINKVIAIAKAENGYLEKRSNSQLDSKTANAGSGNYTKYWRDLANWGLGNYQAQYWCAAFVHWCFVQAFGLANAKKLLLHAPYISCDTLASKSKAAGRRYISPNVGDVVVFWNGSRYSHTGIVYQVSGGYFYTIEGNTSGASGVVSNGGGVVVGKRYVVSGTSHRFHRPDYESISSTSTPSSSTSSSLNESPKWNGTVTTTLNVRTWAGSENATVSFSPLKIGTTVGICDTIQANDGSDWYYIEYNGKHGFASAKYITKGTPSNISASDHKAWLKRLQKAIGAKVDGEPGPETLSKCPVLQNGSSGTVVKLVQEYLGNYCRIGVTGGYDGKFGQGTGAAVMEFQKQNDLTIDAIVGQDTWKVILWM